MVCPNQALACWQCVTVVCTHTHHRSSTTASFVIFCWFHLIDFSPVRSWSPFSGDWCPLTRDPRMAETPKMRLESKRLNFYSGRLSFGQNSSDLSLTWCRCLGTRVLEDPVVGVWGQWEGCRGELLVDEGEGGRGGHPTPHLPIQLWQGHSPKTPLSSWIFKIHHPSGLICHLFYIMTWLLLCEIFTEETFFTSPLNHPSPTYRMFMVNIWETSPCCVCFSCFLPFYFFAVDLLTFSLPRPLFRPAFTPFLSSSLDRQRATPLFCRLPAPSLLPPSLPSPSQCYKQGLFFHWKGWQLPVDGEAGKALRW